MNITSSSVAIITGASSGIGKSLALQLSAKGVSVVLVARRTELINELAEQIRANNGKALAITADVSVKSDAEMVVQKTLEAFNTIDILINNAGRGNRASVEDTTQEMLDSIFGVNVYSLWYMTAAVLPTMKANRRGHIMNVASVAGKTGYPFNSAYVAAKHACVGFTSSLRAELVETGVEATVVCPAGVTTDWGAVTDGGPISDIFRGGIMKAKTIAQERGMELPPLTGMISPDEAAEIMIRGIEAGNVSDIFTHQGSHEQSIALATDRAAFEQKLLPLYLGMQQTYWSE